MNKHTLKRIMQSAHQQASIWVRNGQTDSYVIALSVALKAEWQQARKDAASRAAREARKAQKEAAAKPAARPARSNWTSRTVMLAMTANEKGLNRGKSWICGEMDIQTKGALPEWEGESICYVYA